MNDLEENFVGSVVVVDSLRLYLDKPRNRSDEIFIINKEMFYEYLCKTNTSSKLNNTLAILQYKEDHIIILEETQNDNSKISDFQEYKVLTKNGVGYLMLNKTHEFFRPVT